MPANRTVVDIADGIVKEFDPDAHWDNDYKSLKKLIVQALLSAQASGLRMGAEIAEEEWCRGKNGLVRESVTGLCERIAEALRARALELEGK